MPSRCPDNTVIALRQQVFRWLEQDSGNTTCTGLNQAIRFLIAFSIIVAVLATEPVVRAEYIDLLTVLDTIIAILFLIEYLSSSGLHP